MTDLKCDCECHNGSDTVFCGNCYPLHIGYDQAGKWIRHQNIKIALQILYGKGRDLEQT